jgi:serine/threonine-protein kinase
LSSGATPFHWFPEPAPAVDPSAPTRPVCVEPLASAESANTHCSGHRSADPLSIPPDYDILGVLGRGGMGIVYKARQRRLDRIVALKIMLAGASADAVDRRRFATEAEAVARLQHPNIVQIYEVGEHDGCPYCALEFVDGPDLAHLLDGRVLSPVHAAQLLRALASAVSHAHQRGVVHRDLKPANVLLTGNGERGTGNEVKTSCSSFPVPCSPFPVPKITDFGLAKRLMHESRLTQTGQVIGTPSYMAPEQATGDRRRIGPRTDIYALGAILYECLTGRTPFCGATAWDTLVEVVQGELTPPRQLRPDVPAALETICLKALARDPALRYASAADLAADLQRYLDGSAIQARREGWLNRQGRKLRRHPLALAGLLMLLLVGLTGAGFHWKEQDRLIREATAALQDVDERVRQHQYAEAVRTLSRGLEHARAAGGVPELTRELESRLAQARRGVAAEELHRLAEHVRFHFDADALPSTQRETLALQCRRVWDARARLLAAQGLPLDTVTERELRTDLLDLALCWTDIHARESLTPDDARREALAVLADAEKQFGPGHVLAKQQEALAAALGQTAVAEAAADQARRLPPRSAWEHYTLGRMLLRDGRTDKAAAALERAVAAQPQGFWPNFYCGICAYRRKAYLEAVESLSSCLALAPSAAPCYHNRALALTALGRLDRALQDYDRALELEPTLAVAALNRGLLHARRGDNEQAVADLRRALDSGAEPALVYYNLAVVHEARGDRAAALDSIRRAMRHQPQPAEAVALWQRLERAAE